MLPVTNIYFYYGTCKILSFIFASTTVISTVKNSKSLIAGIATATAASLCCITPVLALLGGVSGLASSATWIEPVRPYLVALTILVFAFAWYQKLKPKKEVECGCENEEKASFFQTKTFLGLVTFLAVLMVAFPYYAKVFYGNPKMAAVSTEVKTKLTQAQFTIKGMSCEGCIHHVNREIAKVTGVVDFHTSYEKATSFVKFNGDKTCIDSIAAAINVTGYTVISQAVIKN
ncbi:MAG: merTP [Segetibacter sp.]|nr:merTP [Segetibacter sp.]